MKTYYIVKHSDRGGIYWYAHKRGFLTFFGFYSCYNQVDGTYSTRSANDCESSLLIDIKKPQVIRVVKR